MIPKEFSTWPTRTLAPTPIDWSKPVRTIGTKEPLRVLCTDAPGEYSVVCITAKGVVTRYKPNGITWFPDQIAENAPPPKVTRTAVMKLWRHNRNQKVFLSIYDTDSPERVYATLLGRKEVTITEGEGI
jgi:hypothetical protein